MTSHYSESLPDVAKAVALIAHDRMKPVLAEFVRLHLDFFRQRKLVATGSTGRILREELGLDVECVAHGPEGGDLIIGGRVAEGRVAAVFFFRDPLTAQPHEPDVSALLRVCDVHQVPLATNVGTARAILYGWNNSREKDEPGRCSSAQAARENK